MLKHRYTCLGLTAMLGGLGTGAALGAPERSPEVLMMMRMSPSAQAAHVDAMTAGPAAALDVTPPVLTKFNASPVLNPGLARQTFNVLIKGTDDLSGIRSVLFQATGPSGQRIFGRAVADYPATNFNRRVGFSSDYTGRLLQPGPWTIDQARVEDVAGNPGKYNQAALAALGNTTFTVVNTGAYDAVAPTMGSGQILTPAVSLSASAKGTASQAPFIGVKVTATDAGSTALAGLAGAGAAFCIAGNNPCLELGTSANAGGQATGTLVLGAQVSAALGHVPGEYELCELVLWDQAGNTRVLGSAACGGTTDFSTLFPSTRITLTP